MISGKISHVVSGFAPTMAKAISAVFPHVIHILDRFYLIQFFTKALQRRRRNLEKAKKQYQTRLIDRCLARQPEDLRTEEREWGVEWKQEDPAVKHIHEALNHMRYVLKATTLKQAARRLKEWLQRYQFHVCGAIAKIAKTVRYREQEYLHTGL
ncbi:transposase [Fictibacillus macauensis ZFHKF-1]|uniref:Transposase n=1 Tax=Fictibacillus macauensis ZFHKF-1 TaxID=1196324 RepID=I8AM11_9BACL|nr:transposase [Fictibacillus macauensis]EIT86704.1 transposase [Fictibacillus macauensis ZFHKF-1]